jgi:hypothetical protein
VIHTTANRFVRAQPRQRALFVWVICLAGFLLIIGAALLERGRSVEVPEGSFGTDVGAALWAVSFQAFLVVGGLIAAKRPGNRIGWIAIAVGVSVNLTAFTDGYFAHARPGTGSLPGAEYAAWFGNWSWIVFIGLTGIFFVLLFPTGRLPSPGWRWVARAGALAMTVAILASALSPGPLDETPSVRNPFGIEGAKVMIDALGTAVVLLPVCILLAAASIVVRYRRADGAERLQLKWFAFSVCIVGPWSAGAAFLPGDSLAVGIAQDISLGLWSLLPISAGIAIFRYRLYEIDRIINKTLVYGALTTILLAGYVGSVLVLQNLLPISNDSPVAVAVSTLAMAALFGPLRKRIQSLVDRRFYRDRYDAVRTLDRFGARLRRETDLDDLTADLLSVIGETLRPAHASLWLRSRDPNV